MKCNYCGKAIVCACCGETEYSQHVGDGHTFVPKECDHIKQCECGNTEFYAHQKCRMNVVCDGFGNWLRNSPNDESACYDSENPYGPFTCTKCDKEYEELPDN